MRGIVMRGNGGQERGWARGALLLVIGAVVALTALLGGTQHVRAVATFTVNSTGDGVDIAPGNGVCKALAGDCSLRAAIMEANAFPGTDNIFFAIPGGGVHTIFPGSGAPGPLPSVTPGAVTIDGTTQPGYAGTPLIEVNGSFAGGGANGIALGSSGNTVKGLAINRFGFAGIHVALGSTGNTIVSNYVGTDPNGVFGIPNGTGVALYGSSNTVGAVGAGNLISGNFNSGVLIDASSSNVLRANRIGTDATGTAAVGNSEGVTIRNGATSTTVGGDYTLGNANIISGNTSYGVSIDGAATLLNLVAGNGIGTNGSGSGAIPNGTGVNLSSGAFINQIGCGTLLYACGSPNFGNLISGNLFDGVHMTSGANSNILEGNGIGVNLAGTAAIPNGGFGVLIDAGANSNTIGGPAGFVGGDRNFISGNLSGGVLLDGVGATANSLIGNYVGTNGAGAAPLANIGDGVRISSGAAINSVGDGTAGGRNVISGNAATGVNVQSAGSDSNTIRGNYIGTDATGAASIPNAGNGVLINNANANSVGGAAVADGNLVSGHGCNVCVYGPATNTAITNNLIGTNAAATGVLGGFFGVVVSGEPSGTTTVNSNTIGGNFYGLYVSGSDGGAVGQSGNTIGTDTTGTLSLANTGPGLYVDAFSTNWWFTFNKIAYNLGSGVGVVGGTTGRILVAANEIHDNGGLGIDLNNDGVTANDPKDPDIGPNYLQNKPVMVAASDNGGGSTAVSATLNSVPNKSFEIDVYSSPSCDPSGFGEGATFLGFFSAVTDANGDANVSGLVGGTPPGSRVTAVADYAEFPDPAFASSSEFSNCVTVAAACAGDTDCDGKLDAMPDNCVTFFNPTQANRDSGPPAFAGGSGDIDNGSGIAANDVTIPNGDAAGDPCDPDNDNDGIPDAYDSEPLLAASCGGLFVGATDGHLNPAYGDVTDVDGNGPSWDTDKDGVRDGVECALGFNPRNAGSKPSQVQCANYHTGGVGPKTAFTDLDNDGLPAYDEYCTWGTEDDPAYVSLAYAQDFDGDGKKDCVEANDTNGDGVQNFPVDTINSAKASFNLIQKTLDFDLDGNGAITFPGDTNLSARMVNHVGGIC